MPIYEYGCKNCGHQLEVLQKMSDEPLKFCPECGQEELAKLISAVGFRLKGGGWYETDFKSSDKKKNIHEDSNSSTAKTDEKSSTTKSPAKKESASQTVK